MPKCEGFSITTGRRCTLIPMRGQRCCFHHLRGTAAVAADHELEIRNARVLEAGDIPTNVERARRSMARIARQRIHRAWKIDPRGPDISTLQICEIDERRVRAWLVEHCAVDLEEPLPGVGRVATPRGRDRMRWAAWRVLRRGRAVSKDFLRAARLRVAAAIRDDRLFWERWEASGK